MFCSHLYYISQLALEWILTCFLIVYRFFFFFFFLAEADTVSLILHILLQNLRLHILQAIRILEDAFAYASVFVNVFNVFRWEITESAAKASVACDIAYEYGLNFTSLNFVILNFRLCPLTKSYWGIDFRKLYFATAVYPLHISVLTGTKIFRPLSTTLVGGPTTTACDAHTHSTRQPIHESDALIYVIGWSITMIASCIYMRAHNQ